MKPTQPPTEGPITTALIEALALRKGLIADGTPEAEADHIVGQGLKAILGNKRPEPWKFYCEHCRDTGWVNVQPSPKEQARLVALYGGDGTAHQGYVVKCEPCKWTQLEREKRRKQGQDTFNGDDDPVGAGQTKPRKGFTKFGR